MNDMKKKLNFGILAIVGVVVFSACGSDSDLFDPEKAAAKKEAQYASAFVQKYGGMSPGISRRSTLFTTGTAAETGVSRPCIRRSPSWWALSRIIR